jgi:hypothetical protein
MSNNELHPSGLTYERWNWPFKTELERQIVRLYLQPPTVSYEFDESIIPF